MTRKSLSRDSGVSERYLAQLETGRGNVSIALLRQIAEAMNVPLADLAHDGPERPVEMTLLERRLLRMTPEEQAEAYRLLFGSPVAALARAGRIALIGLRGAGKTTLGKGLADALGVPFIRLDDEIEREAGMDLAEIFSLSGQAAYRRFERRALERVIAERRRAVIETGGSLVADIGTYALLLDSCFTIWIAATPEDHMGRVVAQGDNRPMAGNARAMEDLMRILANRQALYVRADAKIDTSGVPVAESLATLRRLVPQLEDWPVH